MKLAYLSFTENGYHLAERLADVLGGEVMGFGKAAETGIRDDMKRPGDMKEWVAENFSKLDAMIFIGAAGIAVRAIAPHVVSKVNDPAVVVIDEKGQFAVSLLSGHLGGGNALAEKAARICGGRAVITTATDINGVFAVDQWAKKQGLHISNPERIKNISSELLAGGTINIKCPQHIEGDIPRGVTQDDNRPYQVLVDISTMSAPDDGNVLILIPKTAVIGIGCRRGTEADQIERLYKKVIGMTGIAEEAVCCAASIDLKKDEPGLVEFCKGHKLPFVTFTAHQLGNAEGEFSFSEFVEKTTGVGNVCERSAVTASEGRLFMKKISEDGVTMALALKDFKPDWRWKDE